MMKKLLFITMVILLAGANAHTVVGSTPDLNLGSFEDGVQPWGSWQGTAIRDIINNPSKTAPNVSDSVLMLSPTGAFGSITRWIGATAFARKPVRITVLVYPTALTNLKIQLDNPTAGTTPAMWEQWRNALPANQWSEVTFDLSALTTWGYQQIVFQPSAHAVIHFDNIFVYYAPAVTGVTVSAPNDSILVDDGTLQMSASLLPAGSDQRVVWSVNDPAIATISATGLLTAVNNGVVTVTATSSENAAISGTMTIAVVNQPIAVTGITVSAPNDSILVDDGTLQMAATVAPLDATNPAVTWSVDASAVATISATGLLTAVSNGTVVVTATSVSNGDISGTMSIAVVNQIVPVSGITVTSPADSIKVAGGRLQMVATVVPAYATNLAVTWSVNNQAVAIISTTGMLTAVATGTVVVTATSVSDPAVSGTKTISVTVPAPDLNLGSFEDGVQLWGSWQGAAAIRDIVNNPMKAGVNLSDSVLMHVPTGGWGSITRFVNEGIFARKPQTITVQVKPTAPGAHTIKLHIDNRIGTVGATIVEQFRNPVTNQWNHLVFDVSALTNWDFRQFVFQMSANDTIYFDNIFVYYAPAVTGITVSAPNDSILVDNGTLQMSAAVLPTGSDHRVTWTVNDPAIATISTAGLLTAVNNGVVTVTATSVENTAISSTLAIAVVNQVIPVTGITVTSPADTIKVAGGTLQMAATVVPANATNSAVTWSVDASAIATIDAAGLLTAVSSGNVVVTATSVSDPAVSGTKTIVVDIPVGIPTVDATFRLYPVPVETQLFISSSVAIERVEVLSIVGRTLISASLKGGNALDVSALPAGTYIVRVLKVNGDVEVRTIIKN